MTVWSAAQRALLSAVLNCIVPARDGVPGAGDLGVGASIERSLDASPRLRRLLMDGLAEISITAGRSQGAAFEELDADAQTSVLEAVERARPAFFVALVEHAYRGYYTHPQVLRAVGVERAPQPIGYLLPAFDPSVLDQQRQRSPFWRKTS